VILPIPKTLTRDDVEFFGRMLDADGVVPGQLLPIQLGPLGTYINQLLYDKFHGHGYRLDLLTEKFVRVDNP
jgi:hypothetical protein